MPKRKKTIVGFLLTLLLALSVPFTVVLVQKAQNILTRALVTPANLTVDSQKTIGSFPQSWRCLAQGGEESSPFTLTPVVRELQALSPAYIRIDHIFDFYDLVTRDEDGALSFSFDALDVLVRDILASGALPFFSLSYMPGVLGRDASDPTSPPLNWEEWQTLVQKTIEHYSGRDGLNLTGVYYEVWNEPDLFGRWELGRGEKDYLTLYAFAAKGAKNAQNTNQFFFGGPATTGAYPNWFSTLISYAQMHNLPLDFISWHFYGKNINKFIADIESSDRVLGSFPGKPIQKIVSEWGIDSENNPAYDNLLSASHTLAVIKSIAQRVDFACIFEIKDGQDPAGQAFWGRWGLITHEKIGKQVKPRYEVLQMLSQLKGERLEVLGGGTFVDALASREAETIKILVYNFDLTGGHYEKVPLAFTNLSKGKYKIKKQAQVAKTPIEETYEVGTGVLSTEIIFTPNEIVLVELTKVGSLLSFSQGRGESPENLSLELIETAEQPTFPLPQTSSGSLSFWFKPYWSGIDEGINYTLFRLIGAGGQTLYAKVEKTGFGNQLIFGLGLGEQDLEKYRVSLPIRNWVVGSWHFLVFSYGEGKLIVEIDGERREVTLDFVLLPQNELQLGAAKGVIDDLTLKSGDQVILQKGFDGNLE